MIIWITGREMSGKTTIAKLLTAAVSAAGIDVVWLDGDVWRGMTANTDYTADGRHRNVQRAMQLAVSLDDDRTVVICSFVSPDREQRDWLKRTHGAIEVYLYSNRIRADIKPVIVYEAPADPDFRYCTDSSEPLLVAEGILFGLRELIDKGDVVAPVAGWQRVAEGS